MKNNKVIISEELLNRQKDNYKKDNKSLLEQNYNVYKDNMYRKYQNFNLDNNNVLTLKRIK